MTSFSSGRWWVRWVSLMSFRRRLIGRRGEPVAPHDGRDRDQVGRTAGSGRDHRPHLSEVVGTEDAGGDDGERHRVDVVEIVEAVDNAPADADRLARTDLGPGVPDRPGQRSLEA